MKRILLFSLLSALLCYNFQCGEEDDLCVGSAVYFQNLDFQLSPRQTEYKLGDTLWLSNQLDVNLQPLEDERTINVSNASGRILLFLANLNGGVDIKRGYADFDIINVNGMLSQQDINTERERIAQGTLEFFCDTISCRSEIGLIPKQRGIYCLIISKGQLQFDDNSTCGASVRFESNAFDADSQNKELFDAYNLPSTIRLPRANHGVLLWDIEKSAAAYTFQVQ
ncbi:MAG: hypothetical protein AAFV95_08565 [Bacteroidota bacterium]